LGFGVPIFLHFFFNHFGIDVRPSRDDHKTLAGGGVLSYSGRGPELLSRQGSELLSRQGSGSVQPRILEMLESFLSQSAPATDPSDSRDSYESV
jgi:hypothetical protein